jgi:hypothetical protein
MSKLKIALAKKELYNFIRAQVADRVSGRDSEIQRAEKSLQRVFKKQWNKSTFQHLRNKIESTDLVFWSDFHGVRQFQKNLLRWVKILTGPEAKVQRSLTLALECLPLQSQGYIDAYLAGNLTESDFLMKTQWDKVWGFPWSHYKPLFDWARETKSRILGINQMGRKVSSETREKTCLDLLEDYLSENPNHLVICLYGEHHLLPGGFPSLLTRSFKKKIKTLRVFQNSDELYFRHPPRVEKRDGEIFKLDEETFCLQNVSPWVKWQSYYLFLESSTEADFDEDLDLTEYVWGLTKVLGETFSISINLNEAAVFTSQDRALWDHLKKLSDADVGIFQGLIRESMSFVRADKGWAYLGRISANEAASLAFEIVLFQMNPDLKWKSDSKIFWDFLIWVKSFAYFGSKILNPHRKSQSLIDLQKKSRSLSGRPHERQASRLALNYTLHQSLGKRFDWDQVRGSDSVRFLAVKWLSGLIGEKIFNAYNQGLLNLASLKAFLLKNPSDANFQAVVHQLYEVIDHASELS